MTQMSVTAILAVGMLMVIVSGNIDLSVGSVLGFAGGTAVYCMTILDYATAGFDRRSDNRRSCHRRFSWGADRVPEHTGIHRHARRSARLARAVK